MKKKQKEKKTSPNNHTLKFTPKHIFTKTQVSPVQKEEKNDEKKEEKKRQKTRENKRFSRDKIRKRNYEKERWNRKGGKREGERKIGAFENLKKKSQEQKK